MKLYLGLFLILFSLNCCKNKEKSHDDLNIPIETIVWDKYIIGTIWDKTETKPFILDIKSGVIYMSKSIVDSDTSDFADFFGNSIISYIYPGKYSDIYKTDAHTKEDLLDDNFVICLTELL